MTPLLLAPAVLVYVLLLVWQRQVSTPLAYRSSFLQEVTPSRLKEVSMLPWESTSSPDKLAVGVRSDDDTACTKMTGGGTCTILSKVPIG